MNNFYITTELIDNKFTSSVYNKNTNNKIYQTEKHDVQQYAIDEANMFLRTNYSFNTQLPSTNNPTLPQKRCCGR